MEAKIISMDSRERESTRVCVRACLCVIELCDEHIIGLGRDLYRGLVENQTPGATRAA